MSVQLWTSEPFLDEVTAWVSGHAIGHGLRLTGEREQPHARPWSSAISFGTDGGRLWFKVNGPGTAHEAALVRTIGDIVPDLVPDLLATDPVRGWSLMRDAGPVLRSLAEPDRLWDRWAEVLTRYAEAQRTLTSHVTTAVAEGVPLESPQTLPTLNRQLIEELRRVPEDEGGLGSDDAHRLEQVLPEYDDACAELAASGIPDTVVHDDLHSSNICWSSAGFRIVDWGDAIVGHPFSDMLGTLNSIAWHAELRRDDPAALRARDAFLEPYADLGSHQERVRWVELARYTGAVSKALSYVHAFDGAPLEAQAEFDWPVRGWMLELVDPDTD